MVRVLIPVAALFLWWITVFGSARTALSYSNITFHVGSHNAENYRAIITQLREQLAKNGQIYHGIAVMPANVSVDSDERFVLLNLQKLIHSVTLALDVETAGIVGFKVGTKSYFFKDVDEEIYESPLFIETNKTKLPFDICYLSLEFDGNSTRENTTLGTYPLNEAVTQILNYARNDSINIAPSVLVVKQMISEAARLKFVEEQVYTHYIEGFLPECDIISLEDNWTLITIAIRFSINGNFILPIPLQFADCTTYIVYSLSDVEPLMGLSRGWYNWPCKQALKLSSVV